MADDGSSNSMQAQLGLVGGSGGFNPLGIATPAPPAPPSVRHPGDISSDIVRQTQTAMATTLQTTSAMRLGGMGGVAFGGGGGPGISPVGAFAQQYQQNMMGINQQHIGAFSAQMMGQMGGMGSGFNMGMMPHPAMMTAPGMGIYRPFHPPPGPTVSPFPQMPTIPTPFTPVPPPPQFQTPMELSNNMAIQAGQRRTAAAFAAPGVMARAGADVGFGYMGAGVGAALGARFGPMGAAIGGTLGMAAGAFGSEHFGLGATAQHIVDRANPFRTMAIRGQQMMGASQNFVHGGPDLNMMTGQGLSAHGATHLGRKLEETAYSSRFRRETGGAFSAQDLTKITSVAGQQGLLNDAQSVDQIHDRVKGIAKSLVSFMKIANEPNVVEALKSMGKARQMGLSIGETMDMAMEARMYSRMAGTSVKGIMETGGAQGAMMFQQQGLSAGLGMRVGMGAMGTAQSAVGSGAFTPQRLAMLGGVQGVAQHEMESAAAFLKQPMMAAAVSTMGQGGTFKLDAGAIKGVMSGKMDVNQMASKGVDNILSAVGQHGRGALAMASLQSTEISDSLGRVMGPKGIELAQMNQISAMRKFLGGDKTPGGFVEAAKARGMTDDQIKVFMDKANSPGYFEDQKRHLQIRRQEVRGMEAAEIKRNTPGFMGRMLGDTDVGRASRYSMTALRDVGEGAVNFFHDLSEGMGGSDSGQFTERTDRRLIMSNEEIRRAQHEKTYGEGGNFALRGPSTGRAISDSVLGHRETTRQYYANKGGVLGGLFGGQGGGSAFVGDLMAVGARLGFGQLMATPEEMEASVKAQGEMDKTLQRGSGMTAEDRAAGLSKLGSKGADIVTDLESRMVALADEEKATLYGEGGEVDPAKFRQAAKEAIEAKGGVATEEAINEALAQGTSGAMSRTKNKKAFRGTEVYSAKQQKQYKEDMADLQTNAVDSVLGDTAWFGKEDRQKFVEDLFSGDTGDKSGTYAALRAAGDAGDPKAKEAADKLQNELQGTPEGQEILAEGRRRLEKADSTDNIENLRKVGRKLQETSKGDTGAAVAEAGKVSKGIRSVKEHDKRNEGLALLLKKESAEFGNKSSSAIMSELAASDTSNLSEDVQALVNEWKAETDPGKKDEIASRLNQMGFDAGTQAETRKKGGGYSSVEKAWDTMMGNVTDTQEEMSGMFPESVKTFDEASKAMLKAADKINGTSRPLLPNGNVGTEPGGFG
jgi:hypothetical protein